MRSVPSQAFALRKRRTTSESSCAYSSIALWITAIASRSFPVFDDLVELGPAQVIRRRVAERIGRELAQRLAPVLQDGVKRLPARAVADKTLVVLDFQVVAVDFDRRQHLGAMRADDRGSGSVGHWDAPPVRPDNAGVMRNVSTTASASNGLILAAFLTVRRPAAITTPRAEPAFGWTARFAFRLPSSG